MEQEPIQVTDLKFERVNETNDTPFFSCCNCGNKIKLTKGRYYVDYHFAPDSHFTFVLCNDACVLKFHSINIRTFVNKYINDRIKEAIYVYVQQNYGI